ncbi:hypothetical protein RA307_30370 [Xanthobacteraceae bacterium Astr-EGSB]|uniref:hypothetical protein n=1 Tax=Astrobacterium formosum TaxID=3069710 RepID=UPI0027B74CDA|nr:hypothetical protein [Xanthobacteraceae bacterium Astr-EGSB]
MFTLVDTPTFRHEVKVRVPVDGGHKEESVRVTYRVLPVEVMEKHDLRTPAGNRAFLQDAVIKLDDIVDASNQPIPYSDSLRDQVLSLPYARAALAEGYFTAIAGARAGN